MEEIRSYHKGILLWVDDNFIDRPFKKDIDLWENLFGNQSDKVYRLMNIELKIATNYDSGKLAIEEVAEMETQGCYVICVLDLYLPKNEKSKHILSSDHGIKLAKLAQKKGLNFVFLSTAINISNRLKEFGLISVPFYQKMSGDQKMPDTLIHYILRNFRSNIHWINLKETIAELSPESLLQNISFVSSKQNQLCVNYFPFLGSFKDYVERWEYLPALYKGTIVISRSPKSHSDSFIQQCLLVAISDLVLKHPQYITFRYLTTSNAYYKETLLSPSNGKLIINAIRIDINKTSPEEFSNLIKEIPAGNNIVFFILPNDETSDEYLNQVFTPRKLVYDDFPHISNGDSTAREALIRKSLKMVFHNQTIIQNGKKQKFGELYLAHPELLVNPLSLVILLESTQVAEQISDPFEILSEIGTSFDNMLIKAGEEKILKLKENKPLNYEELLEIGIDTFKKDKSINFENLANTQWVPRTLCLWLLKSWQFPYGLNYQIGKNNPLLFQENLHLWEDFSFTVLHNLIKNYKMQKEYTALNFVFKFLAHKVINKLIVEKSEEISNDEWSDLLKERWPYQDFPIPTSLSKRFKQAGRYFWVETEHFSYSQAFETVRFRHKHLDNVVIQIGERIHHLEKQLEYLPEEWTFYIKNFIDWIRGGKIQARWLQDKQLVYDYLIDFLDNALPISYLAVSCWGGKLSNEKEYNEVYEELSNCTGYGTVIGKILGQRKKFLFKYIVPDLRKSSFNSQREAFKVFWKSVKNNNKHRQLDALIDELRKNNLLYKVYSSLDIEEQKRLIIILGVEDSANAKQFADKLKRLKDENKLELYKFFKDKNELQKLYEQEDSFCFNNDMWETMTSYLSEFQKSIVNNKMDESYVNAQALEIMSELNSTLSITNNKMGVSSVDTFLYALSAIEKLKLALERLNFVDGCLFLDELRWLRNEGKDVAPENKDVSEIEKIFELFCFSAEGFCAQIKFLLELMGKDEMANNIKLKYVESIRISPDLIKPTAKDLSKFIEVIKDETGKYRIYHLGIPGDETKGKKMIRFQKKNIEVMMKSSIC